MLQFPGLISKGALMSKGLEWFADYCGYGWWQKKTEWICHLAESLNVPSINEGLQPFAIELSPWHKPKWNKKDTCLLLETPLKEFVKEHVLNVIHEAIDNSISKFAIFIGKLHCDLLESFDFEIVDNVIDEKPLKETERFYRIYQQTYKDQCHRVLVTWSNGSNHHPSEKFWKFEKELLSQYFHF